MDASQLAKAKKDEEARIRASFYPAKNFKSTLEDDIIDADRLYNDFKNEQEQKASTAANAQQQQQGDTKPEGLRGVVFKRDEQERFANERKRIANEQERIANAAIEQAQIEANARIAAEEARIAAEMKAKEDEETKKWWDGRTGFTKEGTEFSLGTQGGGRNGKKKSKRMIKIKNAKNKSKSKSQSRRQRQKRRRHSRRV